MTLGELWDDFGMTLGELWDDFGMTLVWLGFIKGFLIRKVFKK